MSPMKKTARLAGFLYLLVAITGPFVLLYVPGKLFVPGNATETVNNILAHEPLFRTYIVAGVFAELCFIAVVLLLYKLLRSVGRELAILMVILILIDAPLAFLASSNEVATLAFARGAEFLSVFDQSQREALAALLINIDKQALLIREIFWGLWLLPLGMLVYRSGFMPRLLGIWLFVNGLAYGVGSAIGLMLPEFRGTFSTITMPLLFGEVALMLWLLIVGVREPPSSKASITLRAGALRMSSVRGLKAAPHRAKVLPFTLSSK